MSKADLDAAAKASGVIFNPYPGVATWPQTALNNCFKRIAQPSLDEMLQSQMKDAMRSA